MLKFNYALNLGLATLLVVPAVTLGSGGEDSLEATLQRTLKALDQLAAVEQRLQAGDASAIATVIAATEPALPTPEGEPGARDALLDTLRHDVARLQGDAERLENAELEGSLAPTLAPSTAPSTAPSNAPGNAPGAVTGAVTDDAPATRGLDDALRARLAVNTLSGPRREQDTSAPKSECAPTPTSGAARAFEQAGYYADALRLGRACYRQGRYAEALASFELRLDDVECSYWRARTLEKLGRDTDAIAGFAAVLARKDALALAERAREDLEFLQWRVDFEKRSAGKEKRP
ncbi:MAG: hypothetical protein FJ298_10565 [Planctomycetes bacterium]|nr:hypothetical protein [Planctomycetota bacterium]